MDFGRRANHRTPLSFKRCLAARASRSSREEATGHALSLAGQRLAGTVRGQGFGCYAAVPMPSNQFRPQRAAGAAPVNAESASPASTGRDGLSRWTAARLLIVVASMSLNALWIKVDRLPPAWDQSHYLDVALDFVKGFEQRGFRGLGHAILTIDPARGPALPLAMVPFFLLFGGSEQSGLLLNVLIWPILLLSVGEIASRLVDRRAGLLAMVIAATTPLIVGLSQQVLVEFLLTSLTTLTVLLLLVVRDFEDTRASILLGLVVGAGWLTKVTFPGLIAGPLLVTALCTIVVAVREARSGLTSRALHRTRNVGIALLLGTALPVCWYMQTWAPTLEHFRAATSNTGAYGPTQPLRLEEITAFTLGLINNHLSCLFALCGLAAFALVVAGWSAGARWMAPRALARDLPRAAFVGSWIAVPYVAVATAHNHDPRFVASAMPGVAVLLACLAISIRWISLRRLVGTAICAGGVIQTLLTILPPIRGLPDHIVVATPFGDVVLPVDAAKVGYSRRPESTDDATPIIAYLEAESRGGRELAIRNVGIVQAHPRINPNTFSYLAHLRGDPFTFSNPPADHAHVDQLRAELNRYDFVLYIRPPRDPSSRHGKLALLNEHTASTVLGDKLFILFPRAAKAFPLVDGQQAWVLRR
jgi:4-amino-4-deoxy-L-arabinose transferase-like glycosyltransferase